MLEERKVYENITSAAEVNLMKAEEYRENLRSGNTKSRKKRSGKKIALLIAGAAVTGILAASIFQGVHWYKAQEEGTAVGQIPIDELDTRLETAIPATIPGTATGADVSDVSNVVENVMPAVVAINCEIETVRTSYDFFGREYEQKEQGSSSGTGIIIGQSDSELLIVTNNHVIENAVQVTIGFCDKTTAAAEIKGTEESDDLAVVAVPLNSLSMDTMCQIRLASLGDSDNVKMGEFVIAIGNALGYGQSVTVGYVSALNREVTTDGVTLNLIQVDAAINPGNSGGALLNANGEVIGINSIKYADTAVERVGYAIPISEVLPIINELMQREKLSEEETAYLGIVGKDIDASHANSLRMPEGIYVSEVGENTPAAQAGLHKGDIIVGINGRSIATMEEMLHVLGVTRGGTEGTLQIKVLENGSYVDKELNVVFGYRGDGK